MLMCVLAPTSTSTSQGYANIRSLNSQVILDAAQHLPQEKRAGSRLGDQSQIVFISANTQDSVLEYAERIKHFVLDRPSDTEDMAYTLALHREQMPFRAYLTMGGTSNLEVSSVVKRPKETPNVVLVFSGQGAQWAQMGHELLQSDLLFREDISAMDRILQSVQYPPSWSITGKVMIVPHIFINLHSCPDLTSNARGASDTCTDEPGWPSRARATVDNRHPNRNGQSVI